MNLLLRKIAKKVVPKKIISFYTKPYLLKILALQKQLNNYRETLEFAFISYSQEGEDAVLNRFFEENKKGFYVDVGAHHPKRFSNTFHYYKKGWHGINIDAMPGSMRAFEKFRVRDINLEIPVTEKEEEMTYYIFDEPALNGFSKEISLKRHNEGHYKIIREEKLIAKSLSDILDIHLPVNQQIDFLSVDVEGFDIQVLKSNNWVKYRPNIVIVEDTGKFSLEEIIHSKIYQYMINNEYRFVAKTFNSFFYKDFSKINNA